MVKIISIFKVFGLCLLGMFVLFMVGINIYGLIEGGEQDDYCERVYPSPIEEPFIFGGSWSETSNVENGYLRCCRSYFEEHEKKSECQIFPYNKK